ncbi:MAG: terminase small subunit [Pseudomonadota bacterium]
MSHAPYCQATTRKANETGTSTRTPSRQSTGKTPSQSAAKVACKGQAEIKKTATLTHRQRRFVQAFEESHDAVLATREAGYSQDSLLRQARKNLRNYKIRDALSIAALSATASGPLTSLMLDRKPMLPQNTSKQDTNQSPAQKIDQDSAKDSVQDSVQDSAQDFVQDATTALTILPHEAPIDTSPPNMPPSSSPAEMQSGMPVTALAVLSELARIGFMQDTDKASESTQNGTPDKKTDKRRTSRKQELASKIQALKLLGNHFGLFKTTENEADIDLADSLSSARQRMAQDIDYDETS